MSGLWKRLVAVLNGSRRTAKSDSLSIQKSRARRRLRMELLEQRAMMAADVRGVVYQDLTDNGLDASDPRLSGVSIALVRDGGDGIYNEGGGDDTVVGTTTSAATTGAYVLSAATVGSYFVVQTTVPASGLIQRPSQRVQSVTVSAADLVGAPITTLDPMNQTTQVVEASFPNATPVSSSLAAPEAVGGERDIFVNATTGDVSVAANAGANPDVLVFNVGAGSNGTRVVTYDGNDGNATTLNPNGLNGLDLTTGGTANALRFLIGGEAGTTLTVRIFSGANASTRTLPIPVTAGGAATAILNIPFADFTTTTGTGANFSSVGAIQLEVSGPDAADAIIDSFGTFGPTVLTRNFANLAPMSIGDQIFADRNNNGLFDTGATPPEVGIAGVALQLFVDTNGNDTFDPGVDQPALNSANSPITTTSNAAGIYAFGGLLPGDYFVVIPATQFAAGGVAAGHIVSSTIPTGTTNNSNKGSAVTGGGVASTVVQLVSGGAPTTDGDANNNSNLAIDIGLFSQFDVTVGKSTTATTAAAGSTITYTLTARNDGPGPATGVLLTDDLPDGIQVITATSSVVTDVVTIPATAQDTIGLNPDHLTISVGSLAASATNQRTVTIVARVLPDTVGTGNPLSILNAVTISGLGTETGSLTNNGSVSLPVTRNTGLALTKVGTPSGVQLGNNVTYTIRMQNQGPSTATSVVISDTLPVGLDLISVNTSAGTAIPTQGVGNAPDSFVVNVPSVGVDSPTADTDVVVSVIAQVLPTFSGSSLVNTATVDSAEANPVSAEATNTVQRLINLGVTKSITTNPASTTTPATAVPGSTFTYTILARNDGPNEATTVRVNDNLPDGIRVLSATSSDATDTITLPASAQDTTPANPDDIIVSLGNLGVGNAAQTTITIVGVVLNSTTGSFTNVATITTTDTTVNFEDPSTLGNNTSSVAANAPRTVDLGVTKSGPTAAIAGNTITYTMTATNNGPSEAIGVRVADNIPDGIRVLSATLNGTAITVPASAQDTNPSNPDDVLFSIGGLSAGASNSTLQIVAAILPATVAGSLINSAVISTTDTNSSDPTGGNNSASVTTTVTTQNDVGITKSGPSTILAGSALTYTLNVTNTGPSTATSVSVSDVLPTGVTFVSGTSLIGSTVAGTVSVNNGTASVTIPTLNPGETAVVTLITNVANTATGSLANSATATAANDSNQNNNQSAVITTTITTPVIVSFRGTVYIDANRNNLNDAGDGGIANATVRLTGTPLGTNTSVTQTTTTDASGNYVFNNVNEGNYTVQIVQPTDFVFQAANPGTTAGTAGPLQISNINLNTNSTANNVGFTRVFSKRIFLASSPRP
jgi:uncharacterized repeat protein (TIGR01451 family)